MADRDETVDLLRNWGAWARDRRKFHTCYSAEGRYRAPSVSEENEAPAAIPIDQRSALEMYRAINPANGFPVKLTFILAAEYIFHLSPGAFCVYMRKHKHPIRERDLGDLVNMAVSAAGNAYRRRKPACRTFDHRYDGRNVCPPVAEP